MKEQRKTISLLLVLAMVFSFFAMPTAGTAAYAIDDDGAETVTETVTELVTEPETEPDSEPETDEEPISETGSKPETVQSVEEESENTAHVHCVCGAENTDIGDHTEHTAQTWTPISALSEITESGYYYLTQDVTLTEPWVTFRISDVALDLNGHTITQTKDEPTSSKPYCSVIIVYTETNFTLTDCKNAGKITGGKGSLTPNAYGQYTDTTNTTGGGIYVMETATFNMYGGIISGNKTTGDGAGVKFDGGTFNMYGGTISDNTAYYSTGYYAQGNGGAISFSNDVIATMYGGTITGNKGYYGAGVFVFDGTFTMKGGSITNNTAYMAAGGVATTNSSGDFGIFIMEGGTISGNEGAFAGGGINVVGGSATIKGGTITGNKASYSNNGTGGGIYVGDGTVTLENGTISENTADLYGAGVYISGGTFTMKNGTISNNSAPNAGGGVAVFDGTFNMENGTITENKSKYAGGVLLYGGIGNISGGSITGNTATGYAGGLYDNGTLTISGSPIISDNTAPTAPNLFICSGKLVTTKALTADAAIGVTLKLNTGTFTTGWTTNNAEQAIDIFTSDDSNYYVNLTTDGEVEIATHRWTYVLSDNHKTITATCANNNCPLTDKYGGKVTISAKNAPYDGIEKPGTTTTSDWIADGTISDIQYATKTDDAYGDAGSTVPVAVGDYKASVSVGDVTAYAEYSITTGHVHCVCGAESTDIGDHTSHTNIAWTGITSLPTEAGNYYLTEDITITETWFPADGTALDLNGHTITITKDAPTEDDKYSNVIYILSGYTFTLTDCQGTGKLTGGKGCLATKDDSDDTGVTGGGMYVNGTFNMYGGTITGNTADNDGGGVKGHTATINIYGGSISGNTGTTNAGGLSLTLDSKCVMYGGTISGNKSTFGAGVFVFDSEFIMKGGTICDNIASSSAGGVATNDGGKFVMENGTITGNTAVYNGGGVYLYGGTVEMINGTISNNKATNGYAGGVFVMKGSTFIMQGGAINGGNTALVGGGAAIYNGTFIMNGGVITGNNGVNFAGGIYDASSLIISGSVQITGNTGLAPNLFLSSGTLVTTKVLNADAKVGVYVQKLGTFTTGWKENNPDRAISIFTSDNAGCYVNSTSDGELEIYKHRLSGTLSEDKRTITVYCTNNDCPLPDKLFGIITISAEDAVYDGKEHPATLTKGSVYYYSDLSTVYYQKLLADGNYSDMTTTVPIEAGTYYALTVLGGATAYTSFTISKATPTVTPPTAKNRVYDGTEQDLAEAGTTTAGTMEYSLDGENWSSDIPEGINVGTYTVHYKVVGDENYNDTEPQSITVTISKAPASAKLVGKTGLVYDGNAQELGYAEDIVGGTLQYKLGESGEWTTEKPKATNAGTHTIYCRVIGDDNHSDSEVYSTDVTIGKAQAEALVTAKTLVYNTTNQALVETTGVVGGTVKYRLSQDDDWSADIPTGKNAGKYTVYYMVEGDENHSDAAEKSVEVVIDKAHQTAPTFGEGYEIDLHNETLTTKKNYEFSVDGGETWYADYQMSIDGGNSWDADNEFEPGQSYKIRKPETANYYASDPAEFTIEHRPAISTDDIVIKDETKQGANDAAITIPSGYEYKLPGDDEWKYSTGEAIAIDTTGGDVTIEVRTKEGEPDSETKSYTPHSEIENIVVKTAVENEELSEDVHVIINYYDETVTPDDGYEVKEPNSSSWTTTPEFHPGEVYEVRKKATGTEEAGTPVEFMVVHRPDTDATTVKVHNETEKGMGDGTYTVPKDLEYSTDGGKTWIAGTGEPVSVDTSKGDVEILVRIPVAGDRPYGTAPHGTEKTVIIQEGDASITATFDMMGHGDDIEETALSYGLAVPKPDDPEAAGYTFGGWYTSDEFKTEWDFENGTVTDDITLYAKWTLNAPAVEKGEDCIEYYRPAGYDISVVAVHPAGDGVTLTYQWYKGGEPIEGATSSTYHVTNVADSGEYTCTVTATDADGLTASATSEIIKVQISKTESEETPPEGKTLPYNGEAQELITAGATEDGEMQYYKVGDGDWSTKIPTAVNVGSYKIYYKVVGNADHESTDGTDYVIGIIEKIPATVTPPTAKELTYNGENQTLIEAGIPDGGDIEYKIGEGEWSADLPQALNADEYVVHYRVVGDSNHHSIDPQSVIVTIDKGTQSPPDVDKTDESAMGKSDGTITKVDETMEYSDDGGETWKTITSDLIAGGGDIIGDDTGDDSEGGTIDNLPAGTYLVRYKETDNLYPSEPTTVVVGGGGVIPVTFDVGDGEPDTEEVGYGDTVSEPDKYIRLGYKIIEWYYHGIAFDFDTPITEPTTLTARWGLNPPAVKTGDDYSADYDEKKHEISVEASHELGDGVTLTYQWYKDGEAIEGATGTTYTVTDPADSGEYTCVVTATDENGLTASATSEIIIVRIIEADEVHEIDGDVEDENGKRLGNIDVKLVQGQKVFFDTTTGENGYFEFDDVAPGLYDLVATDNETGKTMTQMVEVMHKDIHNIILVLPEEEVNSVLNSKGDDIGIVVGGLDKEAIKNEEENHKVTITMTVENKEENKTDPVQNKISELAEKKVEDKENTKTVLEFHEVTIEKRIDDNEPEAISETQVVLEIVVPYDFSGKIEDSIAVYRYHEGEMDDGSAIEMTRLTSAPTTLVDGTCYVDVVNQRIHIYTKRFSTYAIGYVLAEDSESNMTPATENSTVTTPTTTTNTTTTTEVPDALNGTDHIAYVSGYPDGTVMPENSITRAEVATMLYRLLTEERRNELDATGTVFSDVSETSWYAAAVNAMARGGYITGYEDGTFKGDESITRAEFVAIMARFLGETDASCSFTDVSESYWAYSYIAQATEAGWIEGYPDGTFEPTNKITRAEAMRIINRVLNRGVDETSSLLSFKQWPDNADEAKWYYFDVIEATNAHTYTGERPSEQWIEILN